MRFISCDVLPLRIPFVEAFRHHLAARTSSDAVVVRMQDELGTVGYGEGLPREYVTGESMQGMCRHLEQVLWPVVRERAFATLNLDDFDRVIPDTPAPGTISDGAARAAISLAMTDCALRRAGLSISDILPPQIDRVRYTGVVTSGDPATVLRTVKQLSVLGINDFKLKVGGSDDLALVREVRRLISPGATLRLDANGAWTFDQAVACLSQFASYDIAGIEQPLPRGPVEELSRLKTQTSIPIIADESLVTVDDARQLAQAQAVDVFNIRISKCGGLARSLEIHRIAAQAGIAVQIGSHVGETALLSAAGRALSAHLPEARFHEGSYGTLLLSEDLCTDAIRFGHGGYARPLRGPGLGVEVQPARLQRYAVDRTTP